VSAGMWKSTRGNCSASAVTATTHDQTSTSRETQTKNIGFTGNRPAPCDTEEEGCCIGTGGKEGASIIHARQRAAFPNLRDGW
jgi:hypothetical protein